MEFEIMVIRLAITFILSMIFGYERQKAHKPAGLGAFTFVAIGSCALTMIAFNIPVSNAIPILAAIVTGIGFLSAGTLIRRGDRIFGATTATSIWLFAIFGISIGLGYYAEGFALYLMLWLVIGFDHYLEKEGIGNYQKKFIVTLKGIVDEAEIIHYVSKSSKKCKLISKEVDKPKKKTIMSFLLEGRESDVHDMIQNLMERKGCESFRLE